jgi:hypothetical protein
MSGINDTGLPSPNFITIGRGALHIARMDPSTGLPDSDGFRHLGNAPDFSLTVNEEDLRHQSSLDALALTDKRLVLNRETELSFTLEEIHFDNIALFFNGSVGSYSSPTDGSWANHQDAIVSSAVKLGRSYPLYDDNGVRLYNLGAASLVYSFEEDPAGTPVTLVEDSDYTIDEEMGIVTFLVGAPNLVDGVSVVGWAVTTPAAGATAVDEMQALTEVGGSFVLMFLSVNPENGRKTEYMIHKVSLSADGDFALISNEWLSLPFTGLAEVNSLIDVAAGESTVLRARYLPA